MKFFDKIKRKFSNANVIHFIAGIEALMKEYNIDAQKLLMIMNQLMNIIPEEYEINNKKDKNMNNKHVPLFEEFVNEGNDKDRTKLKSKLFYLSNTYKNNKGELKYVELKPFKHNIVDKIFVYSNSVVFYGKNGVIDEIKNISMDSNAELVSLIEDRLNDLG